MKHWRIVAEDLIASHRRLRAPKSRSPRRVELSCDPLEERVTPSHLLDVVQHPAATAHVQQVTRHLSGATSSLSTPAPRGSLGNTTPPSPVAPTHWVGPSHSTNTALKTAIQTLRKDVQTIELASGTTVGQLTAIRVAFQKLASDGLKPSSYSALQSFENSLVTANTSLPTGTTLASDTTLLNQFMALYTSLCLGWPDRSRDVSRMALSFRKGLGRKWLQTIWTAHTSKSLIHIHHTPRRQRPNIV